MDGFAPANTLLASRSFTAADQENFAAISGDYNPMHMDPIAARRTTAGACVVHGVHSMLWSLERAAETLNLHELASLDADFAQFLYLDEAVALHLVSRTPQQARLELRCGEIRISQYLLKFGPRPAAPAAAGDNLGMFYPASSQAPLPLGWEQVTAARGTVAYFAPPAQAAAFLPAMAKAIGPLRLAALLSLTRLVGMVSPGLHSTFHRINVKLVEHPAPIGQLGFTTTQAEPRYEVSTMAILADGLAGIIKASRRPPPTLQPACAALRDLVPPEKFAGHAALIIGGSRGLGEITAKLLALGGADVTITYAQGEAEAAAIVQDIRSAGGQARAVRLDVTQPAAAQLAGLARPPASMYFFATPRISSRAGKGFSWPLFMQFAQVYAAAFADCCAALAAMAERRLHVLYPSSVFVTDPTQSMAEYAMAKAAGEVLAADLSRFQRNLHIESVRLPRLQTDQTATIIDQDAQPPAPFLLPLILGLEAKVGKPAILNGSAATPEPDPQ